MTRIINITHYCHQELSGNGNNRFAPSQALFEARQLCLPVGVAAGGTIRCLHHRPPLPYSGEERTQHIKLLVHDYDCEKLLNVAGLTLVLVDSSRHRLPRLVNIISGDGYLECFLGADL